MSRSTKFFLFLSLLISLGCDLEGERTLRQKIEEYEKAGDFNRALDAYDKLINKKGKSPESVSYAKTAAQIATMKAKAYDRALKLFKYIILNSESPEERKEAQKSIADIYFTHLATPDYNLAIKEISKLLSLKLLPEERIEYHINLAKAYFRSNNFYQAQVEIDRILEETKDRNRRYDLKRLKADIYLSSRDQQNAIKIYSELLKEYPEQARRDDLGLSLAVSYEDQEKYDKAIEVLTMLKKDSEKPEYLDLRIKRLKERLSQQPGARGLRK